RAVRRPGSSMGYPPLLECAVEAAGTFPCESRGGNDLPQIGAQGSKWKWLWAPGRRAPDHARVGDDEVDALVVFGHRDPVDDLHPEPDRDPWCGRRDPAQVTVEVRAPVPDPPA